MLRTVHYAAFVLFTFGLFPVGGLASSGNGDEGYPDPWEDYSGKCKYSNQTPIDIVPNVEAELRDLRVVYRGAISGIKHHGHTITLMVTAQNGVLANQDFYELEEAHLHTPSENHINGKTFPMEIHFVHKSLDGHKLILSVMYQYGGALTPTLRSIVDEMPKIGERFVFEHSMQLEDLLPEDDGYYRFNGASADNCREGIMWFVFKEPVLAPKATIEAIHQVIGNNNRPIAPANNRLILE
ncbi:carbonic anhydrase family protein [Vibrio coralliilyticus]|uniref:carbonic anhydrase family protein n=1 Tax=Vibrio coralliilyticus TaxID=190893 RepID=UPI001E47E593|nr:carbonic anhydrase family protein [Vibrio coralliilyticus]MCC2525586.1 carbonic anhydrase family protein [Vibrio coralliilyticus]